MIKFFRRIRQNFIETGKTSKYLKYAIGEIILVVIGILIALQINNWNENQKKLNKEKYYLNSIKTSIKLSQEELDRVIKDSDTIASTNEALFILLGQKNYDKLAGRKLDSLIRQSRNYSIMSLNDGGIREILNTGSLDIIKDESIRLILASWNERLHKIEKYEDESKYRYRNYDMFLKNYFDNFRIMVDRKQSTIIPEKREELMTNPKLANYLIDMLFINQSMNDIYTEEKQFLDSLDVLIDNYLKNN